MALEQAVQGSGHGNELARVQCSQLYGLIFGWSCVEPEVGFDDVIMRPFQFGIFCDSIIFL